MATCTKSQTGRSSGPAKELLKELIDKDAALKAWLDGRRQFLKRHVRDNLTADRHG